MKRFLLAAGLALAALAGPAAVSPAEAYTVKGMGKCSGWVAGEDDRFWLLGFISGYNYAKDANAGRGDNAETIYRWVTRYCKEKPGDDLADAITAYLRAN